MGRTMALIYCVRVCGNLDCNNRPTDEDIVVHRSEHFSLTSALKEIERIAKVDGWRRFTMTTLHADIPGIGDVAGALDDSGPGFAKYTEWLTARSSARCD